MARTTRHESDVNDGATGKPATRFIDAGRRGFLRGAVVAGGAAVAGPAMASEMVPVELSQAEQTRGSAGYRLTDHVREYYAKARF